ncbi:hypothetical protein [Caballeronia sordidicola]|uniref:hypothetical protein n=1 Tax=Caballeronia sordidicola TaxID=196367 RepID=UPI0004D01C06|nr:hypothetical protein [Caballeronia sordidicola]
MRNSTQQKAVHSSRSPTYASRATRVWLAVIIGLAGVVGGYHFQRMLSALPDSNDDFIFF